MENLKKKSKNFIKHFDRMSKCWVILGLLNILFVFLSCWNITLASEEETDKLLDTFFNYADSYYDVDFTNNYDIHSQYFQQYLSYVHYNKQSIKSKFYSYKNSSAENLNYYSNINAIGWINWGPYNGGIMLLNIPNNSNNPQYGFSEYLANYGKTYAGYNNKHTYRIQLPIQNNTLGDIYLVTNGGLINKPYAMNGDGTWHEFLVIYKDDNYYCSVPNFTGNASYFINDSRARLNGQSDFGFFNLDYESLQNIEEFVNFGDLYVGYNYSLNNMQVYLYDVSTSTILPNEINLISTSGLYNGRVKYQPILEDLSNLNESHLYQLICSSSSSILAPFSSDKFKFVFKNTPEQPLPSLIILSGDYNGVGSGEGFKNAINDLNNNLGVISGQINKTNKNINSIKDFITDTSSPDNVINDFFSGDYQDFAQKMGYSSLENNFYDYLKSTFQSIINAINVPIPNYSHIPNEGPSISFEIYNNSFTISSWDLNPFWVGVDFSNVSPTEGTEQHYQSLRIIISVFTNGFICYFIIKKFASWIVKLQTLDFNVVNEVDTDINLF